MQKLQKNIVLIGMRGTGKSAVGRSVAEYLGWEFFDVDQELERGEGKNIPEIVATNGWDFFRDLETKYTRLAAEKTNVVISTGGGVILREENIAALKKNGIVILITTPLDHMARRVARDSTRPSLTGDTPERELAKVWDERKALYEKAADASIHFDFHTENKKTDLIRKSKLVLKAVRDSESSKPIAS